MILLFVLRITLLVVLASSTSGFQNFCKIVTMFRPPTHQDWGRARTAGNRFAYASKLCKIVTLRRPPPHQDWGRTRTAGNCFAYALYAFLLSLQMGCIK
jgi:frataxin-like iron-binding protein CyaY